MCHQNNNKYLFLLLCLLPILATALPSDKKKVMKLTADHAIFNQNTGVGVYTGHVVVDQGTTHIRGNKMITYNNKKNKLVKIKVFGKGQSLARYQTLPQKDKAVLYAKAKLIIDYPPKHYVELIGDAESTQNKNILRGPKLEYYTEKQVLISPPSTKGRTTIILVPKTSDTGQS